MPGPKALSPSIWNGSRSDKSHRVHGIEMAQHQDARLVLAPCRARHQMVAAAVAPGDALDGGRQVAIAVRDHGRELVDLLGGFGRRFDLHPAADAVEDGLGVKRIGGGGFWHAVAYIEKQPMSFPKRLRIVQIGCRDKQNSGAQTLGQTMVARNENSFIAGRGLRARRSARPCRQCCDEAWRRRCG